MGTKYVGGVLVKMDAAEVAAIEASRVPPTTAKLAAGIVLRAATFKAALAAALEQSFAGINDYLTTQIDASALSAAEKDLAKGLILHAADFHRVDPEIGDALLVKVAQLLGFGEPEAGWTSETQTERDAATRSVLDQLFLTAAA